MQPIGSNSIHKHNAMLEPKPLTSATCWLNTLGLDSFHRFPKERCRKDPSVSDAGLTGHADGGPAACADYELAQAVDLKRAGFPTSVAPGLAGISSSAQASTSREM